MTKKAKTGLTRAEAPEMKRLKAEEKSVAERRNPTEAEAVAIAAAEAAHAKRDKRVRPPKIRTIYQGPNSLGIAAPHSNPEGWGVQMMEAFGVDSYAVVERLMMGAGQVAPQTAVASQEDAEAAQRRSNGALAFIASMQPKSTIEATLALQMLASHEASMKMSANLHTCTTREALADYTRLMNQTMRTFTAQVEAMSKLRTGGKQQVEVRYVYVDARTQTVVQTGGGGEPGGGASFSGQPHAPGTGGLPFEPSVPLRSNDASRYSLPVASDQGTEAMPDARGPQPRRPEGRGERKLRLRAVDGGRGSNQSDGASAGEGRSKDAA